MRHFRSLDFAKSTLEGPPILCEFLVRCQVLKLNTRCTLRKKFNVCDKMK